MTIHGCGCCLVDNLYVPVDFGSASFSAARSRRDGDGGLSPGKLVFAEDYERFAGKPYERALAILTDGRSPSARNLGGPSVVALANAAQLRSGFGDTFRFFGGRGEDATGDLAVDFIARLPLDEHNYVVVPGATPRTDVLSDPAFDHGHGERSFINLIGAAGAYGPEHLGDLFWEADIIELGGTGLVPRIHDGMTEILKRARSKGSITFVNLVYDFRSEKARPGEKWKLGIRDDAYALIDILVADKEEALRTSGCSDTSAAMAWFARQGVGTVVVTEGSRNIRLQSSGALFAKLEDTTLPVSRAIDEELAAHPEKRGDTTGCGDNFAGGLLASLAEQAGTLPRGKLDLTEACSWAAASGGFACFTVGGAFYENRPGEKLELVEPFVKRYRTQIIGEKR